MRFGKKPGERWQYRWFAWRPIKLHDGGWLWCEWVSVSRQAGGQGFDNRVYYEPWADALAARVKGLEMHVLSRKDNERVEFLKAYSNGAYAITGLQSALSQQHAGVYSPLQQEGNTGQGNGQV